MALLPSAAYQLIKRGHSVLVEKHAGAGSGYADEDYIQAGARVTDSHEEVFAGADLIVKVKEPQPNELPLLRKGQLLFTYLHLAASKSLTEGLMKSGVTAIAYETVEGKGRLPLLEPMSEIAGRMSVLVGGYFLAKHCGGSGVLLGGVPGVLPGRVVVLGGGVSGVNAARMGTGLGADVTILEVDLERMRFLDITLHTAHTLYSSEAHLVDLLPNVDLLLARCSSLAQRHRSSSAGICCAECGLAACWLISRSTKVDARRRAAPQRITIRCSSKKASSTIVSRICPRRMPAPQRRRSPNVTYRYIEQLADFGLDEACERNPALKGGVNVMNGKVAHPVVAAAHQL